MNTIKWTLVAIIAALSFIGYNVNGYNTAHGAEFTVNTYYDNTTYIYMNGKTEDGDLDRFIEAYYEALGDPREFSWEVQLNGPGGLQFAALELIEYMKERNFITVVSANSECYSACAAIWASGNKRYMQEGATIGFHWAYTETDLLAHIKDDYGWQGLRDFLIIGVLEDEANFLAMNPHIDPIPYIIGLSNSNPFIFWEITTKEARDIFKAGIF